MSGLASCPECAACAAESAATEARHCVLLAWPDLSRDTVMLAVGGERVELAVPEARRLNAVLARALDLRDGAIMPISQREPAA